MPALSNPKYELFAQCIVKGLANASNGHKYSQGRAYIAAGYNAKDPGKQGGSAEVCASRLLNKVQPILDRVRELQAQAAEHVEETTTKIAKELHQVFLDARIDRAHGAAVSAALGKAKVLGLITDKLELTSQATDFSHVQSMQDIGRKLLQQVGLREPDDVSIQEAIAANDQLIAALEAIRDRAQGLTLEHDER